MPIEIFQHGSKTGCCQDAVIYLTYIADRIPSEYVLDGAWQRTSFWKLAIGCRPFQYIIHASHWLIKKPGLACMEIARAWSHGQTVEVECFCREDKARAGNPTCTTPSLSDENAEILPDRLYSDIALH